MAWIEGNHVTDGFVPPIDRFLAICAGMAVLLIALTGLAHLLFGPETADLRGFQTLVDVDSEANLPTALSSLLAYVAAILCAAIASNHRVPDSVYWWGLVTIFFIIGFDEIAQLHNIPSNTLRRAFGVQEGWLLNAWVIPAATLALAIGAAYLRFLAQIPRWLATAFILSGIFYLTGSIGLEIIGSLFEFRAGGFDYDGVTSYSLTFELIAVGEEFFEYLGIFTVLYALRIYAGQIGASLTVRF